MSEEKARSVPARPRANSRGLKKREVRTPIFLHSSFRTGSTWFWSKFRNVAHVTAYCEIFHEVLAELRAGDIARISPQSWDSKHPPTSPYFVEFFNLISPCGGVRGYESSMAYGTFFPDVSGITEAEREYVQILIDNAVNANQAPILSDTRTLGRAVELKRRFGGVHIFCYRNLFHQWNSYSSQHLSGNAYFVGTIGNIINAGAGIGYFSDIKNTLSVSLVENSPGWLSADNYDDVFVAFVATHIYLYLNAWCAFDLRVDVNRLAADPDAVAFTEQEIELLTGLKVDLAGAASSIEAPLIGIGDVEGVRFKLEVLLERAIKALEPAVEAVNFVRGCLDALWLEHGRFEFYTRSLRRAATSAQSLEGQMGALQEERDRLISEVMGLREAVDGFERQLFSLNVNLDEQKTVAAGLHETIGGLERRLFDLNASLDQERTAADGATAMLGRYKVRVGRLMSHCLEISAERRLLSEVVTHFRG